MQAIDWETAEYSISNQTGQRQGPFKGKSKTKLAALTWQAAGEQAIEVREVSTGQIVAQLWPGAEWMFPDLHDEEGNRLPYRMAW